MEFSNLRVYISPVVIASAFLVKSIYSTYMINMVKKIFNEHFDLTTQMFRLPTH